MAYAEIRVPRKALSTVIRALEDELRKLEIEISLIRDRMRMYEQRYGMSSQEFRERYEKGDLGDEEDYMSWYGELVFLEKTRREYEELRRVVEDALRRITKKDR